MVSPKVLALIPAYNEGKRISEVVAGARAHLEVLVVDDGSSDDTTQRAEEAGAAILAQSPNQGKGAALRAGFSYALENDFEAVLTLDADGQHNPAEIPRFLRAYTHTNASLIIGQRDFSQMPPMRRLANSLGQWSFSWAIGAHIPDNQSGYRLIDRALMGAMLSSREKGFEFEVDMIVTCVLMTLKLEWVPIQTIYRGESSHISGIEHILNFVRILYHTRQRVIGNR
jgi:glycosyltransferase involved in cell wall biosynthesis